MNATAELNPQVINPDNSGAITPVIPKIKMGKNLSEKCLLIRIKVGSAPRSKKDKKGTEKAATANGANIDSVNLVKSLLSHEAMDKVQTAGANIRLYAKLKTAPWNDDSERILRAADYVEVKMELEKKLREYYDLVDKMIAIYPSIIETDKVNLNGLFNPRDYPSADTLRNNLYNRAKIQILPVPKSDYRNNALNDNEIEEINNSIDDRISEAIKGAAQDCLERVTEKLGHLLERLQISDGVFRDSAVDNVIKEIDQVKKLNIDDNPQIDQILDMVRDAMNKTSPDSIRANSNSRKLAAKITETSMAAIQGVMDGLI